jgi:NAD(P)H-quinone oxidoreductase subunit 5
MLAWLLGSGPLLLVAMALVPRRMANAQPSGMKRLSSAVTGFALLVALCGAAGVALGMRGSYLFAASGPFRLGLYFDVLSAVMLLLVAFLGMVITRYACRYLEGDRAQGYFLKWLCVTIGAVLTLLVSGNLLMFTAGWILTSFSLHKLLNFYPERPQAIAAARKKFVISRVGDACMLGVLVLTYREFGSWEFADLFARAQQLHTTGAVISPAVTGIGFLLVLGAMLKSAQFPFHSWLPDTMETPTPVSALMHAGIINAGGFLIVRLSPLVTLSPIALDVLALVGATTALFASLVMMTQTSIKRTLAFSTVAQMGFMMLQCGLGAFSIAVLHIVAHSLYKAHAFLASGGVVAMGKAAWTPDARPAVHPVALGASLVCGVLLTLGGAWAFGISLSAEPGVVVLGAIFMMALVHLLWNLWGHSFSLPMLARGLALAVIVCGAYFSLHLLSYEVLSSALPQYAPVRSGVNAWILFGVVALFGALLVLQEQLPGWATKPWCQKLYVHAYNGFYLNTLANRALQKIWPVRTKAYSQSLKL